MRIAIAFSVQPQLEKWYTAIEHKIHVDDEMR